MCERCCTYMTLTCGGGSGTSLVGQPTCCTNPKTERQVQSSWLFASPLHREDLCKKHILLLTRQDVLSPVTSKFLSVHSSHTHTHTDKIGLSHGSMPSTEKKNLTKLDLLGSELEQCIMGAGTVFLHSGKTIQSPELNPPFL